MVSRRFGLLLSLVFAVPGFTASSSAQSGNGVDTFTISVAAPIAPKDVQVRYFFAGELNSNGSIATTTAAGSKISIATSADGHTAKVFKAIAYSSGCQFVTISIDDLSASSRQSEFQCQPLTTVDLRGRITLSRFAEKELQVEALYECQWAAQFFEVPGSAFSPFTVARAHVETDGSFSLQLPDFAADPLWPSLSHDATLMFYLVDARNGERLTTLTPPADLSSGRLLRVAPSYPAVELTIPASAE